VTLAVSYQHESTRPALPPPKGPGCRRILRRHSQRPARAERPTTSPTACSTMPVSSAPERHRSRRAAIGEARDIAGNLCCQAPAGPRGGQGVCTSRIQARSRRCPIRRHMPPSGRHARMTDLERWPRPRPVRQTTRIGGSARAINRHIRAVGSLAALDYGPTRAGRPYFYAAAPAGRTSSIAANRSASAGDDQIRHVAY
jgi:hypothetical protein